MLHAVYTPRVNNNDDEVRLSRVLARPGELVSAGQVLAEVETDKASITVEADRGGYLLRVMHVEGETAQVGSVLAWLGDSPDQIVPGAETPGPDGPAASSAEPTAKARALIAQHGLDAAQIPASGARLSAEDVEAYLKARAEVTPEPPAPRPVPAPAAGTPAAAGHPVPLSMAERGMLRSVLWHRDEAVPAYLEIEYDPAPWAAHALAFSDERRLLGDPLLPLMARRLAEIASGHPRLNSTIVDGRRHAYEHVNVGITIQAEDNLYLVVVPAAEAMAPPAFVEALGRLHRRAIAHRLGPDDVSGATVAFSSMARWPVSRHVPILPPHVSMIVAHTAPRGDRAVLGASYDHRVLSGGDTVAILSRLARPSD